MEEECFSSDQKEM
jgi:hypothetical protein